MNKTISKYDIDFRITPNQLHHTNECIYQKKLCDAVALVADYNLFSILSDTLWALLLEKKHRNQL